MKEDIEKLNEILVSNANKVASSLDFQDLTGKSIMITGSNGLIGINFFISLLQIAKKVSGIKIYLVELSEPSESLVPFLDLENVNFFKGDLTDENFLKTLPNSDIIIHAAGSGIPSLFMRNKLSSLKINTLTTMRLFEKLRVNGKFLFISSSDLYNGLNSEKYSEDQIGTTNTDHPRACYIEGKRTGETVCHIYREMGANSFIVRLSLTYGPGMTLNDSRVLPSFIAKGLEGKIDLLDSGKAIRTFCYVSDAIEMMWFILLKGKYPIYNVGGIYNISISDLANQIGELLKVPIIYPEFNTGIPGAPKNVNIDISRILQESKKEKFVDMHEGLENTINWMSHLKKLQK